MKNKSSVISHKSNNGFSLLELLIYIALLGGIAVFVGGAFIAIGGGSARSEARYEVDSNLRHAVESIRQDVKDATNITSPIISIKSDTLTIFIGPDKVAYDVYKNDDGINILQRTFDALDENAVSRDITSDAINVDSAEFIVFHNVDLSTNLVAVSVNATLTASHNSSTTDSIFTETVSKTMLMEPFFRVPPRGSFGSPGGGGGGGGGGFGFPPWFQPNPPIGDGVIGCSPEISICL